jgi:Trypsin-like peptidase domain
MAISQRQARCGSALVLALLSSSLFAQTITDSPQANSIVQIVLRSADNQFVNQGTGFVISKDGLIATAFHVYAGAVKTVSDARGATLQVRRVTRTGHAAASSVEIAGSDPQFDLIVLRVPKDSIPDWTSVGGLVPLNLSSKTEIRLPLPAHTIGYFGGDVTPDYLRCDVSGTGVIVLGPPRGNVEELLLSGLLLPGHSGSPVIDDGDGAVVGVVSSIVPANLPFNPSQLVHSGLAKAVKVEHLKTILNSIGSK